MVNELNAHALKSQATSHELTPAINIIDAAIARMGGDPRLNKRREELRHIRALLQSVIDQSLVAVGR